MDSKTLNVIEYHKVLERLASHCDFSASQALARQLEPTASFELARARQQETTEARMLLSLHDLTIGGAHDIRPKVDLARHGGVLDAPDMLDIKSTLISARVARAWRAMLLRASRAIASSSTVRSGPITGVVTVGPARSSTSIIVLTRNSSARAASPSTTSTPSRRAGRRPKMKLRMSRMVWSRASIARSTRSRRSGERSALVLEPLRLG